MCHVYMLPNFFAWQAYNVRRLCNCRELVNLTKCVDKLPVATGSPFFSHTLAPSLPTQLHSLHMYVCIHTHTHTHTGCLWDCSESNRR